MKPRVAAYQRGLLPEYADNPLIEALPQIQADDVVLRTFFRQPAFDPSELSLPTHHREKCIERIPQLRCPTPEYLDLFRSVENAILSGYTAKHPFSPTTNYWLHLLDDDESQVSPKTGPFESKGRAITLLGESGVGKTTAIKAILEKYPPVIEHAEYKGQPLPIKQVVYLFVECPESSAMKSFCLAILGALEQIGIGECPKVSTGLSIADLQQMVKAAIRNNYVGLIVVDELQNLSVEKGAGKKAVLTFLLRLINNSGVPFLFCGTPDIENLLREYLPISRRFESGGFHEFKPLDKTLWDLFVERLWRFQWTDVPTPLTSDLSETLLKISCGIHDFAVRTFMIAQQRALVDQTGGQITPGSLRVAAIDAMRLSESLLHSRIFNTESTGRTATDSGDPRSERDRSGQGGVADVEPVLTRHIDRCNHPEFEAAISQAMGSTDRIPANVSLDLMRSLVESTDPLKTLEAQGLLATETTDFSD